MRAEGSPGGINEHVLSTARFLRIAAPAIAGLAWIQALWVVLMRLHDATPGNAGTRAIDAIIYNPVMFVWEAGDLPAGGWGRVALYVYYAALAVLAWNAPAGRGECRLAVFAYGLHLLANLATCFLYVFLPLPAIPGVARFFLLGELREFTTVAAVDPAGVALFGLCLLGGHAILGWRLWRGWVKRRMSPPT